METRNYKATPSTLRVRDSEPRLESSQTNPESRASKCVSLGMQIVTLLVLSVPAASISWTVTHEAIFQEIREFCKAQSQHGKTVFRRKFFYLFTCEYCFSHYVSAVLLAMTRFKLVFPDWRGYVISLFSIVWISNHYISIYNRLRLNIKHENISITAQQKQVESQASHQT